MIPLNFDHSVEESRDTALRALEYVKQFELACTTHPSFCGLTLERQMELDNGINAMRDSTEGRSRSISLALDRKVDNFNRSVEAARTEKMGNCSESAYMAVDYILRNNPNDYAEVYNIDPAGEVDHLFCVVNRRKDSDPKNPATWGKQAFVCDPWGGEVFPASELSKPKKYQFARAQINTLPDGSRAMSSRIEEATFDPSKHIIEPLKNLNTDYIREINANQCTEAILEAYQERTKIILSALDTFKKDLQQHVNRLEEEKGSTISSGQATVLRNKISEIDKTHDEIINNVPTQGDYTSLREQLENKLFKSADKADNVMEFNAEEHKILSEKKYSWWDKIRGNVPHETSEPIDKSCAKAKGFFPKLANVVPNKAKPENLKAREVFLKSAAPHAAPLTSKDSVTPNLTSSKL